MNQQINLYQPIFRRQKKAFSAIAMAQTVSVIALALLVTWGVGFWQELKLRHGLESLRAQERALTQQLASFGTTPGGPSPKAVLETRVQALTQQRDTKRGLLAELSGVQTIGHGLAAHFTGLARTPVPGLWLTRIAVTGGGARIELEGRTARPDMVPRLVQRLTAQDPYTETRFRTLRITRPGAPAPGDEWPEHAHFRLDTSADVPTELADLGARP